MISENKPGPSGQEGIISLITVFIVGLLGLGMMVTLSSMALSGIEKNINVKSGDQSFYTAEAGAREGAYQFIKQFDPSTGKSSYSGGTLLMNYSTSTISVTELAWPIVEIKSETENNRTQHDVSYTMTEFPEGLAFDKAIYSKNDISFNGGKNLEIDGNIFANNSVSCNGNHPNIIGDIATGGSNTDCNNTGDTYANVEQIPPPQINFQDYYNENNAYYGNGKKITIPADDPDGITFASTTGTVTAKIDHTGVIVVKGDLTLGGGRYIESPDYATSMAIIVDGNLTINGGTYIKGIVYVEGTITFSGGGGTTNIDGAVISTGHIVSVGGSVYIKYDPDIVSGWTDSLGIIKNSTMPPRIISWQEQ